MVSFLYVCILFHVWLKYICRCEITDDHLESFEDVHDKRDEVPLLTCVLYVRVSNDADTCMYLVDFHYSVNYPLQIWSKIFIVHHHHSVVMQSSVIAIILLSIHYALHYCTKMMQARITDFSWMDSP